MRCPLVLNHSRMSRGIIDAVCSRNAYDKEKRDGLRAWETELKNVRTFRDDVMRKATERSSGLSGAYANLVGTCTFLAEAVIEA